MNKFTFLGLLISLIFVSSCSDEPDEDDDLMPPTATYYFQAEVDGAAVNFAQGVDNFFVGILEGNTFDANNNVQAETGATMNQVIFEGGSIQPAPFVSINIYKTFPGQFEADYSDLLTIFELSEYPYSIDSQGNDGVYINYSPDGITNYSSEWGAQTGSTFNITEFIENSGSESAYIFKAEFECMLYDEDGNSIELKSGLYRGIAGII